MAVKPLVTVWRCTLIDPKTGECVCQFCYRTPEGLLATLAAVNPTGDYKIGQ